MTHLGLLPSQANLTKPQQLELLTYHRAKQKREQKCPDCKDEIEKVVQMCYWCGKRFTDADGVIHEGDDALAELEAVFGGKPTEEQKAELVKRHQQALKKRGVVRTKGGVKREDWEAFKAKHLQKKA